MQSSLITIAIALCNNEQYVCRCLDSVLAQSYKNIEVIIIDDGSSDNSLFKLKSYNDNRLTVISQVNRGLSSVRQVALDKANGDYICFIDADDYVHRTYVEKMFLKIEEDNSDVCLCSTLFETSEGDCLKKGTVNFSCFQTVIPIFLTHHFLSQKYDVINKKLHLSDSWNKMYRVSSIRKTGVTFCMPKGLNGSDLLFNKMLALHGLKYSVIPNVGYIHVMYPKSAVHRKNKNLKKTFEIVADKMLEECKKLGVVDELKPVISKDFNHYQMMSVLDLYESSSDSFSFIKDVNHYYRDYKCFIEARDLQYVKILENRSIIQIVFNLLYHKGRWGLPLFFKIVGFPKAIRKLFRLFVHS